MLKAYRSDNVAQFKSSMLEMDELYGPFIRYSLCSSWLAVLALEARNAGMLHAILQVQEDQSFDWPFHRAMDDLKHETGGDPEIIRMVEEAGFKSMVPPGKRFYDMHPLDYL
jgi:hypothetical protein